MADEELSCFNLGEVMPEIYSQYFSGKAYLSTLNEKDVRISNVTFEPGCINNWHIHHEGGQILMVTAGKGFYQEEGKEAILIQKGDVIHIPSEVKHWHGASNQSWLSHIAIEIPAIGYHTEWLEKVNEEEYRKINGGTTNE